MDTCITLWGEIMYGMIKYVQFIGWEIIMLFKKVIYFEYFKEDQIRMTELIQTMIVYSVQYLCTKIVCVG